MNTKNVLILFGISAVLIFGGIAYSKFASKKLIKKYNQREKTK